MSAPVIRVWPNWGGGPRCVERPLDMSLLAMVWKWSTSIDPTSPATPPMFAYSALVKICEDTGVDARPPGASHEAAFYLRPHYTTGQVWSAMQDAGLLGCLGTEAYLVREPNEVDLAAIYHCLPPPMGAPR